jgi:hypothetical protein
MCTLRRYYYYMDWRRGHALRERKKKIQATEMKFLKAIMAKTKRDGIRNEPSREEVRMEDTENQINKNRLRSFGHRNRMDEHRKPKTVLEMKMSGTKPKGRPQTWWLDQVKRDIERRGQYWGKVEEIQEWTDRDSWRLL